ncbi:MAG: hypothetical protein HKN95_02525 [Acidimicrobiia bacterium]|nr:hypothetical protein [Acidimicrobiia bacterium]
MKATKLIALVLLAATVVGCSGRADRTDGGGVLLSISDFDGLPISFSVNSSDGFLQVGEIQVTSVIKNPDVAGSVLMNVEIESYEVSYSRGDTGTKVPPIFVRGLFGVVPAGGVFTVENLPVLAPEQFNVSPISDLLFANGGFDKETGSRQIVLNFHIRFFGRTLSGDAVQTAPASFTVTVTP